MASRNKKPHLVLETPDNTESSSSSEASDNSDAEEEELTSTDELQVSFFRLCFWLVADTTVTVPGAPCFYCLLCLYSVRDSLKYAMPTSL